MRYLSASLLVTLGLVSGCAGERYQYLPVDQQEVAGKNGEEAIYAEGGGTVRALSLGVMELKPKGDTKAINAVHLRMMFSNQGHELWHINTSDLRVALVNDGETRPMIADIEPPTVASLDIKPGELKTADFYFPLPGGVKSAKDMAAFDFTWQLKVGTKFVKHTATFERLHEPDMPAYYYPYDPYPYHYGYEPGWGPAYRSPASRERP